MFANDNFIKVKNATNFREYKHYSTKAGHGKKGKANNLDKKNYQSKSIL